MLNTFKPNHAITLSSTLSRGWCFHLTRIVVLQKMVAVEYFQSDIFFFEKRRTFVILKKNGVFTIQIRITSALAQHREILPWYCRASAIDLKQSQFPLKRFYAFLQPSGSSCIAL